MFSTPLICCSIGVAPFLLPSWHSPWISAKTVTVGGAISGYCEIGSVKHEIAPTTTVTIDSTIAKTGRSIKKKAISLPDFSRGGVLRVGAWQGFRRLFACRWSHPRDFLPGSEKSASLIVMGVSTASPRRRASRAFVRSPHAIIRVNS